MDLLNIVVMLTPEQVATEILNAVQQSQHDLTLAPNPDIAHILQVTKEDPDEAEMLVGESFHNRLQEFLTQGQQSA